MTEALKRKEEAAATKAEFNDFRLFCEQNPDCRPGEEFWTRFQALDTVNVHLLHTVGWGVKNMTPSRSEEVIFHLQNRDCSPTWEELDRVLGLLQQEQYNCYNPEGGKKLEVVQEWLKGMMEVAIHEVPFGHTELSEALDAIRGSVPGVGDDRGVSLALDEAAKQVAKDQRSVEDFDKLWGEVGEFFGVVRGG